MAWDVSEKVCGVRLKTERIRALDVIGSEILTSKKVAKKWTKLKYPGKVELHDDMYVQESVQDENIVGLPAPVLDAVEVNDRDAQAATPEVAETLKALHTPCSSKKTPTDVRGLGQTPKTPLSKARRGEGKGNKRADGVVFNLPPSVTSKASGSKRSAGSKRKAPQSKETKGSTEMKRRHEKMSEEASKEPSKAGSTGSGSSKNGRRGLRKRMPMEPVRMAKRRRTFRKGRKELGKRERGVKRSNAATTGEEYG